MLNWTQAHQDYESSLQQVWQQAQEAVKASFDRQVQPVAQQFGNFIKAVQADANECNEECVVNTCFQLDQWNLNMTCVAYTCGCSTQRSQSTIASALDLASETLQQDEAWFQQLSSQVRKAYKQYRSEEEQILQTIRYPLETSLISSLGCSSICVKGCYGQSLSKYAQCLGVCKCSVQPVTFSKTSSNRPN